MRQLSVLRGARELTAEEKGWLLLDLIEAADDDAHMARIVAHLRRGSQFFPTPFDIFEAARRTHQEPTFPDGCEACKEGDGWAGFVPRGNSGYGRCECARGRALAEFDRIVKAQA